MCPYNEAALPQSVISDARATHPRLLRHGAEAACPDYPPAC